MSGHSLRTQDRPAAHVALMQDDWLLVPELFRIAQRTMRVVKINLGFAAVYNVVGLTFALAGALTPLASAILMPVSSLTVIGISAGAMRHAAQRMLPS